MALQLGALREALIEAGASPDKANKAAEELAGYENRLASIETRLAVAMLMIGGLYAGGAWAVWLLLRIAAKLGALA
jgi:hypothetical protein